MNLTKSWKSLVSEALQELGGEATLRDITARLENNPLRPRTATWQATIRRVVRQYKSFEPFTTPSGTAAYRLVPPHQLEVPTKLTGQDPHGEQQGMLLHLGTTFGYETFTNSTDRTIRLFGGAAISKFATVRNDADSLRSLPLPKVRQIDVMWLREDSEGLYPRYAFEVEETTKVKSGLLRLLRIPARYQATLFIIGRGDEEAKLFERYMSDSPFRQHARLFRFHTYDEVMGLYIAGVRFEERRSGFGVELNSIRS